MSSARKILKKRFWRTIAKVLLLLFVIPLIVMSCVASATDGDTATSNETIGKWDTYEVTLTTTQTYSNPFTEVNVSAVFTSPKGRQVKVDGFYDGDGQGGQEGNVWKIRFCPDEVGDWAYTTSSSDSNLSGKSGRFICVPSSSKGPIVVDPEHPKYFKFADGENVFPSANFLDKTINGIFTHEMFSEDFNDSQRQHMLDVTKAHKNKRILVYIANKGDYDHPTTPWVGNSSGPDYCRFDLARWEMYETWIKKLRDEGIIVHIWFFADDSGFGDLAYEHRERLMEYTSSRLSSFSNVMWCIGLEWEEGWSEDEVKHFGNYLKTVDPYDRLVSIHGCTGDFAFPNEPWADYMIIQTGNGAPYRTIHDYSLNNFNAANKPLINSEFGLNEENARMRKKLWSAFTGGCAAVSSGSYQAIFNDFVSTIGFWEMNPADILVSSGYALANPGNEYVIYLPNGGSVTADLSDARGTLNVDWYNPKDGTYYDGGTVTGGGSERFTPPFSGDAVLHILSIAFDTGEGTYPSISGTHTGTIKPSDNIAVQKMYTYSCPGTSGHSEYVRIWNTSETIAEGNWTGYDGDWHIIPFDKPFVLKANETYHYSIRTGSYPQIIHAHTANVTAGTITCEKFVAANGKSYNGCIPAIKLYEGRINVLNNTFNVDEAFIGEYVRTTIRLLKQKMRGLLS